MDTFTFASSAELKVPVNVRMSVLAPDAMETAMTVLTLSEADSKVMKNHYHILRCCAPPS